MDYVNLMKLAADYSDGIIQADKNVHPDVVKYVKQEKIPFLSYEADFEKSADAIDAFYEKIDA